MSGTIGFSLTQRIDKDSLRPLSGGKLYFIQAGTVATPQNSYQDSGLVYAWPNPLVLDAAGNVPQLFFADGNIKIRLMNSVGVEQLVADNIMVIGPSVGGGAGGTVDPTTIISTGDIKTRYGTGIISGFVRLNGRTIGSATSGAFERANADTQALFEYLWNADANLTVSTGRGANSTADYNANKTIALPDGRGRVLAALDDMGNSAAGRLTAAGFGAVGTTLGLTGGAETQTLTAAQIPAHSHPVYIRDPGHTHVGPTSPYGNFGGTSINNYGGTPSLNAINTSSATTGVHANSVNGGAAGTDDATANSGGGTAHPIMPPVLLITLYCKL